MREHPTPKLKDKTEAEKVESVDGPKVEKTSVEGEAGAPTSEGFMEALEASLPPPKPAGVQRVAETGEKESIAMVRTEKGSIAVERAETDKPAKLETGGLKGIQVVEKALDQEEGGGKEEEGEIVTSSPPPEEAAVATGRCYMDMEQPGKKDKGKVERCVPLKIALLVHITRILPGFAEVVVNTLCTDIS